MSILITRSPINRTEKETVSFRLDTIRADCLRKLALDHNTTVTDILIQLLNQAISISKITVITKIPQVLSKTTEIDVVTSKQHVIPGEYK